MLGATFLDASEPEPCNVDAKLGAISDSCAAWRPGFGNLARGMRARLGGAGSPGTSSSVSAQRQAQPPDQPPTPSESARTGVHMARSPPAGPSWLLHCIARAVPHAAQPQPQPRQRRCSSALPCQQRLRLPILLLLLLPGLAIASHSHSHSHSVTSKRLRLELDLRQLRQAVANTGFVGNRSSSGDSSAHHVGSQYEVPGSPDELTTCLNSHQPDNNGTHWDGAMHDELPYFKVVGMWWSRKTADVPMTITTQLSWNRKWQLKAMCRSWAGPIAAVMHMPVLLPRLTKRKDAVLSDVSNQTLQRAVAKVAAFHERLDSMHPCKLDLMLLAEPYRDGKSLVLYPVNTLRNYARLMARTPLIGLVDVDLIVSSNLRRELLDPKAAAQYMAEADEAVAAAAAGRVGPDFATGRSRLEGMTENLVEKLNVRARHVNGTRVAYVLPAFATRGGSISAQIMRADKLTAMEKDQLQRYYDQSQVLRFDWGSSGHKNTEYETWFQAQSSYVVEWSGRYEPWVFVDRLTSTWADSRFRGYGKNKISHMRALAYDGYELRVHPHAFLIHRPHLESSSANAHSRGALYGKKTKTSSMYGHNIHLYKGIQISMLYGNYTPRVHPATAACRESLSWWRQATIR